MHEIIRCNHQDHGAAILDILNETIRSSTALYDYQPRTPKMIAEWFEQRAQRDHPILGVEDESGTLSGFATFGPFRPQPAYKYTVEHSVYVDSRHRGRGIARSLMTALIEEARMRQLHLLVGVIDSQNRSSIQLHESLGFTHSGTLRQAGFKFGSWLDVAFYQLALSTPLAPSDG